MSHSSYPINAAQMSRLVAGQRLTGNVNTEPKFAISAFSREGMTRRRRLLTCAPVLKRKWFKQRVKLIRNLGFWPSKCHHTGHRVD